MGLRACPWRADTHPNVLVLARVSEPTPACWPDRYDGHHDGRQVQVEVGTPWDTAVSAVLLIEALFTRIAEEAWPDTQSRIEQWDALRLQLPGRDEPPD